MHSLEVGIELEDLNAACGKRIWFEGDGYAKVIKAIEGCCWTAIVMGQRFVPDPERALNYFDFNSDANHHFEQFRTDDYPPDGYASLYFHPSDSIPSPWGNLGYSASGNFWRDVRVCYGAICDNPNHASHAVANRAPPRLRPVVFSEVWGVSLLHCYVNRQPTNQFQVSLGNGVDLACGPGEYGFFKQFDAEVMSVDAIRTLPGVQKLYQMGQKVEIQWWMMNHHYPAQRYDPESGRWRGIVTADIKEGFFSTTRREFFVE